MIVKLIFLWYSSNKRYFVTDVLRSYWNEYIDTGATDPSNDMMSAWEEETDGLLVQLHENPQRIFVIVPSSLASTKGKFVPTFGVSNTSHTLRDLKTDGNAHVVMIKVMRGTLKLSEYENRIRKALDKAQELSAQGVSLLPITILTEEIGANLFLQTVAKLPICLIENLFDAVVLYNPIFGEMLNDRAANVPLDMSQRTIVNTFHAKFGDLIAQDFTQTIKDLNLPVLILSNNIYEEVHGISFRNLAQELLADRECNIHRMHIDTERISALLADGDETVEEQFSIVVNTWNEIAIEKIILFVKSAEEMNQKEYAF